MQFKKTLIVLALLVFIGSMPYALAQDEEKSDRLAQVVLITPKDGQAKALEDAITKYHHFMADKEGAWRYNWYSIVTGPDTGKYIARSGGHNWADFDAENDWDEEAGAKFMSEVQPHIADADFTITQTDDEIGIWPENLEGYEYYSVTMWHIKSGSNTAFKEGLKKIDATLKAGGWPNHYAFINTVSGGKGNSVTLVSPRKNFADMAPKEPSFMDVMSKAMGEEEAQAFMAEWGPTYVSGQNQLLQYRPKLSDYGDG